MEPVFLQLLNVSVMAGWIVLAVVLLRLCFKKAPRWITCMLWGLVALRLVLPFSIESAISLIPSAQTVPDNIVSMDQPEIHTGLPIIDQPVNDALQTITPVPDTSSKPVAPIPDVEAEKETPLLERVVSVAAWVWIGGVVVMVLYGFFSVWRVRRRVLDAVLLRESIWQSDRIDSPFILGIFRPRIYLPYGLDESTMEQVLAHERSHLHRKDHWIKPFAYLLLTVYWFNPLLWVAYILLCRDIEVACDQRVLRGMTDAQRRAYAMALLQCGVERRTVAACPLAFGEVGIKQRIKSALHYRKPLLWVIIASLLVCSVAAVCLLTVPHSMGAVLSRESVEADQDRKYYSTDIDGTPLTDEQVDWLWKRAENRRDREDDESVPLVITDTADATTELWQAIDTEYESTMPTWFDFGKYNEAFFEDNVLLWMYVQGDDNGDFDYSAELLHTSNGLCYQINKSRERTNSGGPMGPDCNYLLLFEVDRETAEDTRRFMTRYEWAPLTLSEEYEETEPIGSADLDGDGRAESITVAHNPSEEDYYDVDLIVRNDSGTILMREAFGNLEIAQFYLCQQDGELPKLLLVENMDDSDERAYAFSLEGGKRSLEYIPGGGWIRPYAPLDFSNVVPYYNKVEELLEDATLLAEVDEENRVTYYGDTLDQAQYVPLSWMELYRQSESDTLPDLLENVIPTVNKLSAETPIGEMDYDGDGRMESLSVLSYEFSAYGEYPQQEHVVFVRDNEGRIVISFELHSYYYNGITNNYAASLYLVQKERERARLAVIIDREGQDRYGWYFNEHGDVDYDELPDATPEELDHFLNQYGQKLCHISNDAILTVSNTYTVKYRPSWLSVSYQLETEVETDAYGAQRIRSLSLWNRKGTKLLERYDLTELFGGEYEWTVSTDAPMYLIDVTFDRKLDVMLPDSSSARYTSFVAFRWDAKRKGFIPLTTSLQNPAVDAEDKVIRVNTHGDQITSYSMWVYDKADDDFVRSSSLYFEPNNLSTGEDDKMKLVVDKKGATQVLYVRGEAYALDKTDARVAPYYLEGSFWDLDSDKWTDCFFKSDSDDGDSVDFGLYKDVEPDQLTEEQAQELATMLVNRQIDIHFLTELDWNKVDKSVTCRVDENYVLCTDRRFTCVQDIRDYVSEGLTAEAAKVWFDRHLDGEYDPPNSVNRYIEFDGKLWTSTYSEGAGWSMTYLTDTARIISRTQNSVTVEMDTLYFGDENNWKYTPTLLKTDEGWRMNTADFGAGYEEYLPGAGNAYLSIDSAQDTLYNRNISAFNAFLSGKTHAVDKTDNDSYFYVTDMIADLNDTKGPRKYAVAYLRADAPPYLLAWSYNGTLDVFTVMDGEVVRVFENPAGVYWHLLSNGALWRYRSGIYWYTTFGENGTYETVEFRDPGEGSSLPCYFGDRDVSREEYKRLTAPYFQQYEHRAEVVWYDYTQRKPLNNVSSDKEDHGKFMQRIYPDAHPLYYVDDLNGDNDPELMVYEDGGRLRIFTRQNGRFQSVIDQTFVSGTSRFFKIEGDYPGLFYFCVGGGKNRYYYLSMDKVKDQQFVKTELWTDNYGFFEEDEEGRITKLTDNETLIELSRNAYDLALDVPFVPWGVSVFESTLYHQHQNAAHLYASHPESHRDIGVLQSETQEVINIDGKYYQTYVASNADMRYIFVSNEEYAMNAYWDWIPIGTAEEYSLSNIGKIKDSRK